MAEWKKTIQFHALIDKYRENKNFGLLKENVVKLLKAERCHLANKFHRARSPEGFDKVMPALYAWADQQGIFLGVPKYVNNLNSLAEALEPGHELIVCQTH